MKKLFEDPKKPQTEKIFEKNTFTFKHIYILILPM